MYCVNREARHALFEAYGDEISGYCGKGKDNGTTIPCKIARDFVVLEDGAYGTLGQFLKRVRTLNGKCIKHIVLKHNEVLSLAGLGKNVKMNLVSSVLKNLIVSMALGRSLHDRRGLFMQRRVQQLRSGKRAHPTWKPPNFELKDLYGEGKMSQSTGTYFLMEHDN